MRVRGRIRRPLATVGAALAVWLIVGRIHLMRLLRRPYSGMGRIADAGIEERIRRELLSWPSVTVAPHRYGGIEFRLGKRELGHLPCTATISPISPSRSACARNWWRRAAPCRTTSCRQVDWAARHAPCRQPVDRQSSPGQD